MSCTPDKLRLEDESECMPVMTTLAAPKAAGKAAAHMTPAFLTAAPRNVAKMGWALSARSSTIASTTAGSARACTSLPKRRGYLICTCSSPQAPQLPSSKDSSHFLILTVGSRDTEGSKPSIHFLEHARNLRSSAHQENLAPDPSHTCRAPSCISLQHPLAAEPP